MYHQMRVYTINRGAMDTFVRAWQQGVYPLRIKMGFRVGGAWINRETNQFIWILSYDGDDWDGANAAYYNAPERKSLDPDPASMIARMETYMVDVGLTRPGIDV